MIHVRRNKRKELVFIVALRALSTTDYARQAAKKVSDFLGTEHHSIVYTMQEGLDAIREVGHVGLFCRAILSPNYYLLRNTHVQHRCDEQHDVSHAVRRCLVMVDA